MLQIPLPGQEWKDLTSAKIAELVKLLQEVPGLAENLKHKLPDISFETQLLSTEDITKVTHLHPNADLGCMGHVFQFALTLTATSAF